MNQVIIKTVVNGAVIIIISLLLFFVSTWWRMNTQYSMGEKALRNGDFSGAVAGFESAIHMYIPDNATIQKAAQQLWNLGETNEAAGDINRALIAYRALRSSFYSATWLKTPGQEWIARCDDKIFRLVPLQRER